MKALLHLLLLSLFLITSPANATMPMPDFDAFKVTEKPRDIETEVIDRLVKTLESKSARKEFTEQLRTMLLLRQQTEKSTPNTPVALNKVNEAIHVVSEKILDFLSALDDAITRLMEYLQDPELRLAILLGLQKASAVLAIGLGVDFLARFFIRKNRPPATQRRISTMLVQWTIDLLSVLCMIGAMLAFRTQLSLAGETRELIHLIITALSLHGIIVLAFRVILAPRNPVIRLVHLHDPAAFLLYRYLRMSTFLLISGLSVGQIILILQGPLIFYTFTIKVMLSVLCLDTLVLIRRVREPVCDWLTAKELKAAEARKAPLTESIARTWHIWASLYVIIFAIATFVQTIHHMKALALSFIETAFLVIVSYWMVLKVPRYARNTLNALAHALPHITPRKGIYAGFLAFLVGFSILFGLLFLAFEIWEYEIFDLIFSDGVTPALSVLINLFLIAVLGIVIWEVCEYAIARVFKRPMHGPDSAARRQRLLTMMPLVENTVRILLLAVLTLMVFSELSLDITPLLAGVGVIGIAFSFGSQSLVKDIIAGIFILVEDTINVGDIVQIDGQKGVVEALSIRTVRLRDTEGNLHTIPFGTMNKITNMTKNFAFYMIELALAYRQNVEPALAVLTEIDQTLRADPKFKSLILEPLEILGVDRFSEFGVVLMARIKTLPDKSRWVVGREFNRQIKNLFAERGIEFSHQYKEYEYLSPFNPVPQK